jgi:SAM-dependent methyltransferase
MDHRSARGILADSSFMHLTRFYRYRRIGEAIQHRLLGRILGISGIANFQTWIDREKSEIVEVSFPQVDMQNLPFADEQFDVVISDQVITHLENPHRALSEAFRVLKPGGIGIHTTRVYGPSDLRPSDYFRFTTEGLGTACPRGISVLQLESWGNRFAIFLMLIHDEFFRFMEIPDRPGIRRWLAMYNEKGFEIHTWIVARKSEPAPSKSL